MTTNAETPPPAPDYPQADLVEHGFMDSRAKLIDIAAFLDRLERHGQADDYRVDALKAALPILLSEDGPVRAREVLRSLSDPSDEPIPEAHIQGAAGAYQAGS